MSFRQFVLALFMSVVVPGLPAFAQQQYPWQQSQSYGPAVPTVKQVLGYEVGERFTPYHRIEDYYRALAAKCDRMQIGTYGHTYAGNTLYLLKFSAPKNLARIDEIRNSVGRLTDPRKTTAADAQGIASKTPAIVWLGYGVHGNEANSAEAAMQVAYELCASQDAKVQQWLDHLVILIDPLTNPDGRERYVQWYNQTAGAEPVPDRFAAEKQERWPSGRYNHYYFDLNRDWAWQSQIETQGRIAAYLQWNPQVFVDLHETSPRATYFFAPPARPFHELLRPLLSKWWEIYGRGNAAVFDKYGYRYFTREVYDVFAPTYGDTWPSLNGAVGMTYEMAGGGNAGLITEFEDNFRPLSLKDRAVRHFLASLATINTTFENRQARLNDFYEFHRAAMQTGASSPVKQYFLLPGADPQRINNLLTILLQNGIEVQRADAEFTAENLTSFLPAQAQDEEDKESRGKAGEAKSGKNESGRGEEKPAAKSGKKDADETRKNQQARTGVTAGKRLPAGTYIVDLAQPAGILAKALLEPDAKLETSDTYDITAWALPYSMGIEAYSGAARVNATRITESPAARGEVSGAQQATAFLVPWEQTAAVGLLDNLLREGFRAWVSIKPLKFSGREFAAGTVVVPQESNPPSLQDRIRALAAKTGAQVIAISSSLAESGVDLGSQNLRFVRRARIAVVMDEPVDPAEYGTIWHLFDQRIGIPFTPLKAETIVRADLKNYNVIIVPPDGGSGRGFSRAFDESATNKLKDWVRQGNVLITMGGSSLWASKARSGFTSVRHRFITRAAEEARIEEEKKKKDGDAPPQLSADDKKKKEAEDLKRKLMTWAEKEKEAELDQVPGTILRARLDITHPLGFGLTQEMAVLNRTSPILELSENGDNVAYFPKQDIRLSGFITPENEKKLGLTAYAIREGLGRGQVVMFADAPAFRGFWQATERMLLNAVYFGAVTNPKLD